MFFKRIFSAALLSAVLVVLPAQADEQAKALLKESVELMNKAESMVGQGNPDEVDSLIFEAVEKADKARALAVASGVTLEQHQGQVIGYGDHDGDGKHDPDHPSNLAEQTQNPVASLISVPLESNFNFGVGDADNFKYVMNVKPVIPQKLSDDWTWIHRGIQPIIAQDNLTNTGGSLETDDPIFGMGDLTYQGFLTPGKPGKVIWGVGGVLVVPWGEDGLTQDKWQAGPGFVALTKMNSWVFGSVITQQWDFAGKGSAEDVSVGIWQYFVNYNMKDGWFLTSSPTMSANWEAEKSGDKLTIPYGGGFGKIFKIDGHPFRASMQVFNYASTPDAVDTDWTLQAEFRLLFPR
jgi:hypothetical protein